MVGARKNALLSVVLPTTLHGHRCSQCDPDPHPYCDADSDVAERDSKGYPDSSAKGNTSSNEE